VFSDGSVLDSIENIALLNADNYDWNEYPYGRRRLLLPRRRVSTQTGHWWSGGVGIENLRVNGRAIFNDILAVYQDVFFLQI
jgi:hypothetical protein